ncbi:mechanosensitive ion channel [Marinihelvus fidelis]|uniref:Small-conductance mechanosensitive channel n=1 Tax=Marinihelvus fidelis TaxID=2613842 RepID=A0A5N0T9D9_9GAMM|nr:mechanosensitive ion channel family protein [Marinihelvus fidelis]KAA9131663.1 mechanosensitive ion channel [Marinihelvus fidelis]
MTDHLPLRLPRRSFLLSLLLFGMVLPFAGWAQSGAATHSDPGAESARLDTAPVRVDGQILFHVRGITAFPADVRAARIRRNIINAARDESFDVSTIETVKRDGHLILRAGDVDLVTLVQADSATEQVPLEVLARAARERVAKAIEQYREDRTPDALRMSALYLAGLTLALVALVWVLGRLKRWLNKVMERKISAGIRELERKSKRLLNRQHLWGLFDGLLKGSYVLVLAVLVFTYIDSVLGVFPWTRGAAKWLLEMVTTPLLSMGRSVVASLPDLFFLFILFLVVRGVLRFLRLFFQAIGRKQIVLPNFDNDWAMPTYKLVRLMVIAFSLVIAYPYIPGSESAAFKGVSLFLGVVVSLGSTSFISNMIAGLSMTYRGAYREGDWVRIGDEEGKVEEMRMMVMRLRTRKNECVTIPNSVILNANVINYSNSGDSPGVLLHPEIGIGYDTSWRMVEAMLVEAAYRTEGLRFDPAPFVNQKALGDFAITYELNVLIDDPATRPRVTTQLFQNIQDVFNENDIQIMSPAYETDPETPKVVPKSAWPAKLVTTTSPKPELEKPES